MVGFSCPAQTPAKRREYDLAESELVASDGPYGRCAGLLSLDLGASGPPNSGPPQPGACVSAAPPLEGRHKALGEGDALLYRALEQERLILTGRADSGPRGAVANRRDEALFHSL